MAQKTKEDRREYKRKYYQENRESILAKHRARYRAKKAGNIAATVSGAISPLDSDLSYALRLGTNRAKTRAKKKGLAFDITIEWVIDRVVANNSLCEKTGIKFDLAETDNNNRRIYSPSIDRVDNTRGYTRDNTQIVCWVYNNMKNDRTDDELLSLCDLILEKDKEEKREVRCMNSTNFKYWLRGYFELTDDKAVILKKLPSIRKHLELVERAGGAEDRFCNWLSGVIDMLGTLNTNVDPSATIFDDIIKKIDKKLLAEFVNLTGEEESAQVLMEDDDSACGALPVVTEDPNTLSVSKEDRDKILAAARSRLASQQPHVSYGNQRYC